MHFKYIKSATLRYFFILMILLISFLFFVRRTNENNLETVMEIIRPEIKEEQKKIAVESVKNIASSTILKGGGVAENILPAPLEKQKNPEQKLSIKQSIILDVPFSSQAPFGEWGDPRQQDGCEEMAALMAMRWVRGQGLKKAEAKEEILAMAKFEQDNFGTFVDTSASDTVDRIFKGYFKYDRVIVKYNIKADDIKNELRQGRLVIVPANGQELGNPYYTAPGPERHNLLICGYNADKKEFITNDAGTRRGERYRYKEDILFKAIRDYPTGDHLPIIGKDKNMIVVFK